MIDPRQSHFITVLKLQTTLRKIELWFENSLPLIFILAYLPGLMSLLAIPDLHQAIRLVNRGHTIPVVIAEGHDETFLGGGPSGVAIIRWARVAANPEGDHTIVRWMTGASDKIPADKRYSKGDHAFLTYSEKLHYGVITAQPPQSFSDILQADADTHHAASFPIVVIAILTITNLSIILLAALEHIIGSYVTDKLKSTSSQFEKTRIIVSATLEALLAGTLSAIPIAATLAAFSISIRMESDSLWTMYIIYGLLLLFFSSHVTAGAAIGLLKFFRSKIGQGIKEIIAYSASLVASIHVIAQIFGLTFADSVLDLSSWWQVGAEFGKAFF